MSHVLRNLGNLEFSVQSPNFQTLVIKKVKPEKFCILKKMKAMGSESVISASLQFSAWSRKMACGTQYLEPRQRWGGRGCVLSNVCFSSLVLPIHRKCAVSRYCHVFYYSYGNWSPRRQGWIWTQIRFVSSWAPYCGSLTLDLLVWPHRKGNGMGTEDWVLVSRRHPSCESDTSDILSLHISPYQVEVIPPAPSTSQGVGRISPGISAKEHGKTMKCSVNTSRGNSAYN